MSNVPPAVSHRSRIDQQHAERLELLAEADKLATQLISYIERLYRIEPTNEVRPIWQQCALLARRVRGQARGQADKQRHRAKRRAARKP